MLQPEHGTNNHIRYFHTHAYIHMHTNKCAFLYCSAHVCSYVCMFAYVCAFVSALASQLRISNWHYKFLPRFCQFVWPPVRPLACPAPNSPFLLWVFLLFVVLSSNAIFSIFSLLCFLVVVFFSFFVFLLDAFTYSSLAFCCFSISIFCFFDLTTIFYKNNAYVHNNNSNSSSSSRRGKWVTATTICPPCPLYLPRTCKTFLRLVLSNKSTYPTAAPSSRPLLFQISFEAKNLRARRRSVAFFSPFCLNAITTAAPSSCVVQRTNIVFVAGLRFSLLTVAHSGLNGLKCI